jgi:hypothetical protein
MVSPYKDYSCVFRWQANVCVLLCNYGIASMKVCCDFWSVDIILFIDDLILLFVALIELLELVDAIFCCL